MRGLKRNMENKTVFAAIIVLIVVLTIALLGVVVHDVPNNRIPMRLTISDKNVFGLSGDTDAIYFGTMPPSAIDSIKKIIITNDFETKRKVELVVIGDLKEWVSASDNNFILGPKEFEEVTLTATVPENPKVGNYTSELLIYLRKV